jgi:RNA polymerase sigma-70 factor (ECF subfamily)
MTAIARNRAIDLLRSERIERNRSEDSYGLIDSLTTPLTAEAAIGQDVRRCLDALDREARDCVILAYCLGLSREELAARFGRPVGTIKTVLHRSLKLLKACLDRT